MRLTGPRFTILHLMIAAAVIACFLALLQTPAGFLTVCVLLVVLLTAMAFAMFRGYRSLSFWAFVIGSVSVNFTFLGLSIYASNMWGMAGMFLGSLFGIPLILGFGTAWSVAATRRETARRRSPLLSWPLVIVLTALPLTMLISQWPLRLAFLASQPALDRLADRVAAGNAPGRPVRAGLFIVFDFAVDPTTGNVGLITMPDPSGRSGFVRVRPATNASPSRVTGPFFNLNDDLPMSGRWRYQSED